MDFDPRDIDSRADEHSGLDGNRGHRSDSDHDRGRDDCRQPAGRDRDVDAREPGRGPGESRQADSDGYDPGDEARGGSVTAREAGATSTRARRLRATSAYLEAWNGTSSDTATASTRCAARLHAMLGLMSINLLGVSLRVL
jgi:hypothetical protein